MKEALQEIFQNDQAHPFLVARSPRSFQFDAVPKKKAQLHVHTTFSDGTSSYKKIVHMAQGILDDLVVTDHDGTPSAVAAWEYNQKLKELCEQENGPDSYALTLWVGEEATTTQGDMLGIFMNVKTGEATAPSGITIPANMSAEETALAFKEVGATTIAAHPEFGMASSMDWETIAYLHEKGLLHAVEVNGGAQTAAFLRAYPRINRMVPQVNQNNVTIAEYRRHSYPYLSIVGDADMHNGNVQSLLSAYTEYPSTMTLPEAIRHQATDAWISGLPEHVTLFSYAEHKIRGHKLHQKRKDGDGIIWVDERNL